MDAFLAKVGSEFDSSFVKLHVGTDDLDELVEFTWERSDLSPLVDVGLKPLLRNKLFKSILEERAARSKCVGVAADMSSHSSTGMPSSASLRDDDSEVPLSEVQDDASSLSQVCEASILQVATVADGCTSVDAGNDSSATPRSSQTVVSTSSFDGFCTVCGEYGHKISECKVDSSTYIADFPALGVAGKSSVVPQAQVSINGFDERKRRQVAQKEAAEAQKRAEKDRQNKVAEAQASIVRDRHIQCHYCLGKGHRLRDCPKKIVDMQESARQRAQEVQDRVERQRQQQEEDRQKKEEARQKQKASQARGYGRQFGRSSDQSTYASGGSGVSFERRWQTVLAGKWCFLDDATQMEFEKAYAAAERIHKFNARGWNYHLDLDRMVQINLSTARERLVRRLEDADVGPKFIIFC